MNDNTQISVGSQGSGDDDEFAAVLAALRGEGTEIARRADVVRVEAGYRFVGGRITNEPALVVVALPQIGSGVQTAIDALPAVVGDGVPVEVRPADIAEQIAALTEGWPSLSLDEARLQRVSLLLPGDTDPDDDTLERGGRTILPYVPPADAILSPLEGEEATLLCHASPDAGWPTLRDFIAQTQTRLVGTMYDFNGAHIADAIIAALNACNGTLTLVQDGMGSGARVPMSYLTIEQTVERLRVGLGNDRFSLAWAATNDDPRHVHGGFFPRAYHIKTLVRDGKALWLSSGNWRPSSQPPADPLRNEFPDGLNAQKLLDNHNREWHIVVENETLARLFEQFIQHDFDQAIPHQVVEESERGLPVTEPPANDLPFDVIVPEATMESFRAATTVQFFAPRRITDTIRIEPLLTPDRVAGTDGGMFIERITELVAGAKRRVWLQNQYISLGGGSNPSLKRFSETLARKSVEPGVEVRVLLRDGEPRGAKAEEKELDKITNMLQALQRAGMKMDCVLLQHKTHNKGILIDDDITVVGSHNFSGQGVLENRDASLVLHSAAVNAYYTEIFNFDWEERAYAEPLGLTPVVVVPQNERGFDAAGTRRVPLAEFLGDL